MCIRDRCLGHQAIAEALGARITRAQQPMHGMASTLHHDGQAEFTHCPPQLKVGRYHSLIVDPNSVPAELLISARSTAGEIMALRHRTWPVVGWQFHPESILTDHGLQLMRSFFQMNLGKTKWHKGLHA